MVPRDTVVIACNDAVGLVKQPDYFFTYDLAMADSVSWDIVKAGSFLIVLDLPGNTTSLAARLGLGSEYRVRRVVRRGADQGYLMRRDDKKLVQGGSCVHAATHLAVVMGCSPIVLYGCECALSDGKVHWWEARGEPFSRLRPPDARQFTPADYAEDPGAYEPDFAQQARIWSVIARLNVHVALYEASGGRLRGLFPQWTGRWRGTRERRLRCGK